VALNRRKCRKQDGIESALERRKYETELERQNNQLGEFASVISHDLRNPLTVADGYLELVSETGDGEYFTKVGNAHDRMDAIIENVLTLTRQGKRIAETSRIELQSITSRLLSPPVEFESVFSMRG
jgi:signal transduction histidine kinase